MTDISLKSENGKYDIILRNLEYGVVIIDIKEELNNNVYDEALNIAKKYSAKKIYIRTPNNLDSYKVYKNDFVLNNEYTLTKSYKEIKLQEVEITDRDNFISLLNTSDLSIPKIDQFDALNLIKTKKCYFFSYKDKKIGVIVYDETSILYFACNNMLAYDMCISKALYKIGINTEIVISSLEQSKLNKFKNFGFEIKSTKYNYYEV